ncbi:MAG: phosphatidylserine decarboxylase family protein [Desulfobacteraceae bacterium]|nr:phosphatidylserine decarboxylase family protein [Desulfobacteraceae bacterium]
MTLIEKIEKFTGITKYGYPIIGSFTVAFFIFLLAGIYSFFLPLFFLTVFSLWFFRDPERKIPSEEDILVSPADGKVIGIENLESNNYDGNSCIKVSIFMSVFNVHVNRIPFSGKVKEIRYFPGKFFNASLDKASEDNERNAVLIETDSGIKFWTVQIAGLIARRIITPIKEGDVVIKGDRYGMIRFGSRLELYLPVNSEIMVKKGQMVNAGSSVICRMK